MYINTSCCRINSEIVTLDSVFGAATLRRVGAEFRVKLRLKTEWRTVYSPLHVAHEKWVNLEIMQTFEFDANGYVEDAKKPDVGDGNRLQAPIRVNTKLAKLLSAKLKAKVDAGVASQAKEQADENERVGVSRNGKWMWFSP